MISLDLELNYSSCQPTHNSSIILSSAQKTETRVLQKEIDHDCLVIFLKN